MRIVKVTSLSYALAVALCISLAVGLTAREIHQSEKNAHFVMWQLPSQIGSIGMSYVIRTDNGRVVVIDGGMVQDAAYLKGFIAALGNEVDAWFISHTHDDHGGALNELLKNKNSMPKVKAIYTSLCDKDWYTKVEPDCLPFTEDFYANLKNSGIKVVDVNLGQALRIDGVRFKILGIKNPEFTANAYNESSIVLKATDSKKSVLFLGDLGAEGGKKLLAGKYAKEIRSDYVQMSHHGQNGVNEDCYKAIHPKYCLWPTPLWLWNNDSGKGPGSGPWRTLEVREWMNKLGILKNYPSHEGLVKIE